jgi:MFS family permease
MQIDPLKSNKKQDLKNSIYDGIFAHMFATLTGGVFLTGFALYLGMNEFMIGLLGAMPFLATIFQVPTSYLIGKTGRRKKVAYWAAAGARLMWIPVLLFGILPIYMHLNRPRFVLTLVFLSHAFVSISYVSWLSWMSDLVPEGIRGRFFGTRNMLNGAAGMMALLIFGTLLDHLKSHPHWGSSLGFSVIFLSAVSFGILSLRFLNRVSEPLIEGSASHPSSENHLWLPFRQVNFRRFLVFILLWSFSVYFASPFFTLYFLRDLRFSYGFVALLSTASSLADLVGMRFWGRISDRVQNKAVIRFAGWVAAFLPMAWAVARPGSVIIPILLHLIGGGFWAGINLCSSNLLLKISPQENRAFFLSMYSIMGGIGAAVGPIVSGLILSSLIDRDFHLLSWEFHPLQGIFLISSLLRLLSLQLFRRVEEPEEVSVGQMVRILRGVRGLNMATGFNYLLHPFIEIGREIRKS